MNDNTLSFSEKPSLKDLYPVLIGFQKAILPDTDVALNIDKRLYSEKYTSLLVPGASFVSTDKITEGSKVGTLVQIRSVQEKEDVQSFFGRSMMRVRLDDVIYSN